MRERKNETEIKGKIEKGKERREKQKKKGFICLPPT